MGNANSVSDLERAEHASSVLAKRVTSVNTVGSTINPATEEKQDSEISSLDIIRLQTEQLKTLKLLVSLLQRPIYSSPTTGRLNVDSIISLSNTVLSTYTPPSGNTASNIWLGQGVDTMRTSWALNVRSKIS